MTTIKQLVRFPSRLRKRFSLAKKIQYFDALTDQVARLSDGEMANGWCKTTIDEFLESPGIAKQMRESSLRRQPDVGKEIYWSWDIPDFVWNAVLSSKRLDSMVRDYLGADVRLDDLYVKTVKDGLQSGAEGWHDDNVGYRLKVFMIFDVDGIPSDTLLIPQIRPNLYYVKVKEEAVRLLGAPDKDRRASEVRVSYNAGDCLIFDTNLLHRGDYTSSAGMRYCLVAEFIAREKANSLRKHSPCGPGQSAMRIRIPILNNLDILTHHLIDKDLLERLPDHFLYGYPDGDQ
jgi:hypothetical protein